MSFLSAVGHFFTGVEKVTTTIDPFLQLASQAGPQGGKFQTIVGSIIHVEQLTTQVAGVVGNGVNKKAAVIQLVTLAYPDIDQAALSQAVDGIVKILKILNDLATAKPTPKPTS